MVEVLPLTLVGDTLGDRHYCLNKLINNACQENVPLQSILEKPEDSSIDRVFKIKLASKYKDVEYLVENLKSKDMLYVSLVLKNVWLLETPYRNIINPIYLETHIYPYMITTAVNKMKNFIELKLRNPERCQEFYEYYKSNYDVAIKFLWHCSKEFIIEEVSNVTDKLTTKHLRILCEVCPQVARIYFDGLQNNRSALKGYLMRQVGYFSSILNILKVNGDLFLDLIEEYFDSSALNPLSSSATRYIMKNFKNRYLAKPELYAACLLNVKTLVRFLNHDEIKDILLKLARAQYLNRPFTYKHAEPFIKCLKTEDQVTFKRKLFVDKSIGSMIENWPYPPPKILLLARQSSCEPFQDIEHYSYEYEDLGLIDADFRYQKCKKVMKRKCNMRYMCITHEPVKSRLDELFDRYRFLNFDRTFFELRKLLSTEGSIEGRRNIMLVLVSKAGGNETKLKQLLTFLVERHSNEPIHLRDAIARSMVKRAFVWRLSSETWDILLKWTTTSVSEILHSLILRHLLTGCTVPPTELAAYLLNFCTLTTYSLNATEKACIAERLPALLISANSPQHLLDTLQDYKLSVYNVPGAEEMLISAAHDDENILRHLFKSRIARKHLTKVSFKITQNDAAYMNALKHDLSLLENGKSFAALLSIKKPNHDNFLRTLVLYFSEPDGLAARHRIALQKGINEKCESFARPLAFLFNMGNESFRDYIEKVDGKTKVESEKKFASAIRANAMVARPLLDIDEVNWHTFGAKFICNNVLCCSDKDIDKNIEKCLLWKKTIPTAARLATRSNSTYEVFAVLVKTRPIVALKLVLADIRKGNVDLNLWNQVKPVILNLDLSKRSLRYVKRSFINLDVTSNVEADYWTTVYNAFYRVSEVEAMPMLCKIENLLTEVDDLSLKQIISKFLNEKLNKDGLTSYKSNVLSLYFRVIAKYLLTSECDHVQKLKKETVCDPFFDKIERLWQDPENKATLITCLDDFLIALKYSKAFLNTKYDFCIPIFESILEHLPKILPRVQYFEKYVHIHLTMLYYRSIRQALKQRPEIFENTALKRKEGVKLVGLILGKYIGKEILDLEQTYFKSINEIYQRGLVNYYNEYFDFNESRGKLMISMIKGLIDGGPESQLLAQHIYEKEHSVYVNDDEGQETWNLLKNLKNEEIKFFLNAHIYDY